MKIVAVTACIVGLAHCKMSRQALLKEAKKEGIDLLCEVQSQIGIDHKLTAKDIAEADVVMFATDVAPRDRGRFKGKKIYQTATAKAIRHPDQEIAKALALVQQPLSENE